MFFIEFISIRAKTSENFNERMKPNHAWNEDIAVDHKGIRQEGADCIHFPVDRDTRLTNDHGNEP
jgi:hypothetical protein